MRFTSILVRFNAGVAVRILILHLHSSSKIVILPKSNNTYNMIQNFLHTNLHTMYMFTLSGTYNQGSIGIVLALQKSKK
jgi:hypothetical protein